MADEIIQAESKSSEDTEKSQQGTPADTVKRWLRELDAADRHEKTWRERAEKIVNLYKDQRSQSGEQADGAQRRFNILYANTEVLKGAMYQRCPVPDIRRRWLDKDPVGRLAALVLTRAVITTIDRSDLDGVLRDCVQDMVLPGRGQLVVKYKPTLDSYDERVPVDAPAEGVVLTDDVQQDADGYFRMQAVEEVTYECAEIEYVDWTMVRYSPAKRWQKMRWIAFGELLTRDDLIAQFGKEVGEKVALKWAPKGMEENEENAVFKRALVWTIYNKTEKKCVVVCDGYATAPLKEAPDPLKLEEFFPSPKPLYAIQTTDSMVPTPEYAVYQDHALDLDALEERISVLQEALRRRGVYDASIPELEALAKTGDNKFIPVKNFKEFVEKGGLEFALQEQDLSNLAATLAELMKLANEKKNQIYEIIGIADIMRGTVDPNEKLGQSQLKSQYGSMRTGPRQAEVQRFARDTIRLVAEVIAEHFSPQTLAQMTGIELAMDDQEKMLLAQTTPDDVRAKRPTWADVMKVLRSDKLRSFKVGIETDSTIKPQADQEQKNRVELITGLTQFVTAMLPAVQEGLVPKKVASEMMMFGARAFPAATTLEETLDEWASGGIDEMLAGGPQQGQMGQQQPDAAQAAEAVKMQQEVQQSTELHRIAVQRANADLVKARAAAYAEITKAEALVPGLQLDHLMQEANLKRAEAQAKSAAEPATETLQ
jgi:hypothetical protein